MKKKIISVLLILTILCTCIIFTTATTTVSATTYNGLISGRIYRIVNHDTGLSLRTSQPSGVMANRFFVVNRINSNLNTEFHFKLVLTSIYTWEIHPIYDNNPNFSGTLKMTVSSTVNSDNTQYVLTSKDNHGQRQQFLIVPHQSGMGYAILPLNASYSDYQGHPLRISQTTGKLLQSSNMYPGPQDRTWDIWYFQLV